MKAIVMLLSAKRWIIYDGRWDENNVSIKY